MLGAAIAKHGYPPSADPAQINYAMGVLLLSLLVAWSTARSRLGLSSCSRRGSDIAAYRCLSTSATVGSAASCRLLADVDGIVHAGRCMLKSLPLESGAVRVDGRTVAPASRSCVVIVLVRTIGPESLTRSTASCVVSGCA